MTQPTTTTPTTEATVETKPFWRSKTVWAAILGFLYSLYSALAPQYNWPTDFLEPLGTALMALGLLGLRTANTSIAGTQQAATASGNLSVEQANNVVPNPAAELSVEQQEIAELKAQLAELKKDTLR